MWENRSYKTRFIDTAPCARCLLTKILENMVDSILIAQNLTYDVI